MYQILKCKFCIMNVEDQAFINLFRHQFHVFDFFFDNLVTRFKNILNTIFIWVSVQAKFYNFFFALIVLSIQLKFT